MGRRVAAVLALVLAVFGSAAPVFAIGAGLVISPVRQEVTLTAGQKGRAGLQISNRSEQPMTVSLGVKQFSVANYTYDYKFQAPIYNWVKFSSSTVTVKPQATTTVGYDITVPATAASGGYYYALGASTREGSSGITTTVQADSLLYLTVSGNGVVKASDIENAKVPFLVTGTNVSYSYDVKNTGNVHFTGSFSATLQGLFGSNQAPGVSHIVLPGTTRNISGSVQMPLLPGVYRLTYGYKADNSSPGAEKTAYVVFVPPWSVAGLLFIVLAIVFVVQRVRRPAKP